MTKTPKTEDLELLGGEVGVLILLGTQDSDELASNWAAVLHRAGKSVTLTRIFPAANGWQDLHFGLWQEWLTRTENALSSLINRCSTIFIVGIDVASTLALRITEIHGVEIDGIILVEPSLPDNRLKLRKIWKMVDEGLHIIDQPLLIMYSTRKEIDYSESAITISNNVSSPFIREVLLENSYNDQQIIAEEASAFIDEVTNGFWLTNIATDDDADLIDAEFESMVAGLSLDESSPSNYLDDLDKPDPEDHFIKPNPTLEPIHDSTRRSAIMAMILGPIYALTAVITGFDPFGVEPWPGILTFLGGLIFFFYSLRDDHESDDGAIL